MSIVEWFAQEFFSAVRYHDQYCQKKAKAFCELFELSQIEILQSHFATLSNVQLCKMGWPYPRGKRSALCIESDAGKRLYCEMKAVYKTLFKQSGHQYPAYLWSPFQNASKAKSAGFDLARLATLTDSTTTHIALILIGSSLPADRMDQDFDKFAEMAHIQSSPWESYRDYWPNQWHSGYYYDLRVWGCKRAFAPDWWASIADVFCPYGY